MIWIGVVLSGAKSLGQSSLNRVSRFTHSLLIRYLAGFYLRAGQAALRWEIDEIFQLNVT